MTSLRRLLIPVLMACAVTLGCVGVSPAAAAIKTDPSRDGFELVGQSPLHLQSPATIRDPRARETYRTAYTEQLWGMAADAQELAEDRTYLGYCGIRTGLSAILLAYDAKSIPSAMKSLGEAGKWASAALRTRTSNTAQDRTKNRLRRSRVARALSANVRSLGTLGKVSAGFSVAGSFALGLDIGSWLTGNDEGCSLIEKRARLARTLGIVAALSEVLDIWTRVDIEYWAGTRSAQGIRSGACREITYVSIGSRRAIARQVRDLLKSLDRLEPDLRKKLKRELSTVKKWMLTTSLADDANLAPASVERALKVLATAANTREIGNLAAIRRAKANVDLNQEELKKLRKKPFSSDPPTRKRQQRERSRAAKRHSATIEKLNKRLTALARIHRVRAGVAEGLSVATTGIFAWKFVRQAREDADLPNLAGVEPISSIQTTDTWKFWKWHTDDLRAVCAANAASSTPPAPPAPVNPVPADPTPDPPPAQSEPPVGEPVSPQEGTALTKSGAFPAAVGSDGTVLALVPTGQPEMSSGVPAYDLVLTRLTAGNDRTIVAAADSAVARVHAYESRSGHAVVWLAQRNAPSYLAMVDVTTGAITKISDDPSEAQLSADGNSVLYTERPPNGSVVRRWSATTRTSDDVMSFSLTESAGAIPLTISADGANAAICALRASDAPPGTPKVRVYRVADGNPDLIATADYCPPDNYGPVGWPTITSSFQKASFRPGSTDLLLLGWIVSGARDVHGNSIGGNPVIDSDGSAQAFPAASDRITGIADDWTAIREVPAGTNYPESQYNEFVRLTDLANGTQRSLKYSMPGAGYTDLVLVSRNQRWAVYRANGGSRVELVRIRE